MECALYTDIDVLGRIGKAARGGVSLLLPSLHKALRWALESFLFRLYTAWMSSLTGF